MARSTAPVTVGWYLNPVEAQIAKSQLESEGIPAFLHSINHSSMIWPITLALGGIQLQVPPSAVDRAKEILEIEDLAHDEELVLLSEMQERRYTNLRSLLAVIDGIEPCLGNSATF